MEDEARRVHGLAGGESASSVLLVLAVAKTDRCRRVWLCGATAEWPGPQPTRLCAAPALLGQARLLSRPSSSLLHSCLSFFASPNRRSTCRHTIVHSLQCKTPGRKSVCESAARRPRPRPRLLPPPPSRSTPEPTLQLAPTLRPRSEASLVVFPYASHPLTLPLRPFTPSTSDHQHNNTLAPAIEVDFVITGEPPLAHCCCCACPLRRPLPPQPVWHHTLSQAPPTTTNTTAQRLSCPPTPSFFTSSLRICLPACLPAIELLLTPPGFRIGRLRRNIATYPSP